MDTPTDTLPLINPVAEETPAPVILTQAVVPPPVVEVPAEPVEAAPAKPIKAPVSGQSGPALKLTYERLNSKEVKLLSWLSSRKGPTTSHTIEALAAEVFTAEKLSRANSWVRNCLRRLVRAKLILKTKPGSYRIGSAGRAIMK